jgi:predicted nuclease of predicted toxin-antitoxin system
MRLKLDENLSRHLKTVLNALQHDVKTAEEQGLLSQPDTLVAAAAKAEHRMLLTLDVEFGDLRKYPPGGHPGIILFRPRSLGPLAVNSFVEDFFRSADIERLVGCLVIVESTRLRIRWPALESDSAKDQESPV